VSGVAPTLEKEMLELLLGEDVAADRIVDVPFPVDE
jgi:hypothetical protein